MACGRRRAAASERNRLAHQRRDVLPGASPCGSRCRWRCARSWLQPRPAHHRHGRSKAMEAAERFGMAICIVTSSPPSASKRRISSACVSSVTALTTSRPPGANAAQAASSTPARLGAAADEHRVRRRQAGQRVGRRALDDGEIGHAERCRIAGGARRPRALRLDRRSRGFADGAASTRCRWSPSPRRCPRAARPGAARAPRASWRGCRAW